MCNDEKHQEKQAKIQAKLDTLYVNYNEMQPQLIENVKRPDEAHKEKRVPPGAEVPPNIPAQIRALEQLERDGIISPQIFEAKKKRLLGL